jgi:hypothetical protein
MSCGTLYRIEYSAYLFRRTRADERTRSAFLLQLRVLIQTLQVCARVCRDRISKPVYLTPACRVLHANAFPVVSEWCQLHPRMHVTQSSTYSSLGS